jgi:beta-phosphoglucomutase family hydrolase
VKKMWKDWKFFGTISVMETTTLRDIRAVIFDMDGVIVDSEPLHLLAYQEFFNRHNIGYTAEHNAEFLGTKDIWMAQVLIDRHALPETPESMVKTKEAILMRLLTETAVARPGLSDILTKAKQAGLPMSIASSATLPTIHLVVDRLNIRNYFDALTSGDEVANGKPAPDVFLLAAKRLAVEPRHCLVIEDTLNGIKAAKAAGMMCIAIPCEATMHQDHSLADVRMQSLEQINFQKDSDGVLAIAHAPARAVAVDQEPSRSEP